MLGHFINGFLQTLLVAAVILISLYVWQNRAPAAEAAPVIAELTDAYRQGWEVVSKLAYTSLAKMGPLVAVDSTGGLAPAPVRPATGPGGRIKVGLSWSRAAILDKLRTKGYSRGALRGAERYLDYIEQYRDEALLDMYRSGVTASITLAQGIIESNAGESRLARTTNNHFGIKARQQPTAQAKIKQRRYADIVDGDFYFVPPAIGVSQHWDDNQYDRFEVYPNVLASFRRHSDLLTRPCTGVYKGCYAWIWRSFPVSLAKADLRAAADRYQPVSGIAAHEFFDGQTDLPYFAAQAAGLKMAGYATSPTYHRKLAFLIETYELWRFDIDLVKAVGEGHFSGKG